MNPIRQIMRLLVRGWINVRMRRCLPLDVFWVINMPMIFQCLHATVALHIPDLLKKNGPLTVDELAAKTGTSAPDLFRVLRALDSLGFYAIDRQGRFRLTPNLATLCEDSPFCLRHWYLLVGDVGWPAGGKLLEAVKTGGFAFRMAHGLDCWDLYEKDERLRRLFDLGMSHWTILESPAIVAACNLKQSRELVDVGGGRGTLLVALLKANPHLRGIVFDRPEAVPLATEYIAEAGLADRCRAVGGDFTKALPESDTYVIKHALHDWPNELALRVLKTIRAAIKPDGRLLIIDAIINPRSGTDRIVKWLDVSQMLGTTGHVRTEPEFRELLAEAGFELVKITPTAMEEPTILECRPV